MGQQSAERRWNLYEVELFIPDEVIDGKLQAGSNVCCTILTRSQEITLLQSSATGCRGSISPCDPWSRPIHAAKELCWHGNDPIPLPRSNPDVISVGSSRLLWQAPGVLLEDALVGGNDEGAATALFYVYQEPDCLEIRGKIGAASVVQCKEHSHANDVSRRRLLGIFAISEAQLVNEALLGKRVLLQPERLDDQLRIGRRRNGELGCIICRVEVSWVVDGKESHLKHTDVSPSKSIPARPSSAPLSARRFLQPQAPSPPIWRKSYARLDGSLTAPSLLAPQLRRPACPPAHCRAPQRRYSSRGRGSKIAVAATVATKPDYRQQHLRIWQEPSPSASAASANPDYRQHAVRSRPEPSQSVKHSSFGVDAALRIRAWTRASTTCSKLRSAITSALAIEQWCRMNEALTHQDKANCRGYVSSPEMLTILGPGSPALCEQAMREPMAPTSLSSPLPEKKQHSFYQSVSSSCALPSHDHTEMDTSVGEKTLLNTRPSVESAVSIETENGDQMLDLKAESGLLPSDRKLIEPELEHAIKMKGIKTRDMEEAHALELHACENAEILMDSAQEEQSSDLAAARLVEEGRIKGVEAVIVGIEEESNKSGFETGAIAEKGRSLDVLQRLPEDLPEEIQFFEPPIIKHGVGLKAHRDSQPEQAEDDSTRPPPCGVSHPLEAPFKSATLDASESPSNQHRTPERKSQNGAADTVSTCVHTQLDLLEKNMVSQINGRQTDKCDMLHLLMRHRRTEQRMSDRMRLAQD